METLSDIYHKKAIRLMELWTFRCYINSQGHDEVDEFFSPKSRKRAKAKLIERVMALQMQPSQNWSAGGRAKTLSGECQGLVEIRFLADRIQYRPVGFFGPSDKEFTILVCAIEKGNQFVPKDVCSIAQRRKIEVIRNQENSCVCFE